MYYKYKHSVNYTVYDNVNLYKENELFFLLAAALMFICL